MSHAGGHPALVGMTVMDGGHGEMEWMPVLTMIHNLQLWKASLIMTAAGRERALWIAGGKKKPPQNWVFSNFLLLLNPFAVAKAGAVGAAEGSSSRISSLWGGCG